MPWFCNQDKPEIEPDTEPESQAPYIADDDDWATDDFLSALDDETLLKELEGDGSDLFVSDLSECEPVHGEDHVEAGYQEAWPSPYSFARSILSVPDITT